MNKYVFWSIMSIPYLCILLLILTSLSQTEPPIDTYPAHYIIVTMALCTAIYLMGILVNFVFTFLTKQQFFVAITSLAFIILGNAELMYIHAIIAFYDLFPPA